MGMLGDLGRRGRLLPLLASLVALGLAVTPARAFQEGPPPEKPASEKPASEKGVSDPEGILNLDIDQLAKVHVSVVAPSMSTEVTSVAKQESTIAHSPAAIYVITSEMIHRSPATNIPDLLRMVPGVEVVQFDSHTWGITIRGDQDRYTNKVLVLIDGRSVSSPITGAVNWDELDLMLEDIDRIEVTRGPNGTLWGANAVNGMINIISKRAKDTTGALVTYGGGSQTRDIAAGRWGEAIGDDFQYRVFGRIHDEGPGYTGTDSPYYAADGRSHDAWDQNRVGFRADWQPGRVKNDELTIQGDVYGGNEGIGAKVPIPTSPYLGYFYADESEGNGNLLGRWTHTISDDSDWMVQAYFDRNRRVSDMWGQDVSNVDLEFQHRFPIGERHEVIWGGEWKQTHDSEWGNPFVIGFNPAICTVDSVDGFIQDQYTLVEDRWFFTPGIKLGTNELTGFEYSPTTRLLFTPDKTHSLWAAISRSVAPNRRINQQGYMNSGYVRTMGGIPLFSRAMGPEYMDLGYPSVTSEHMISYELGYRAEPTKRFSYDIALYYYKYDNLWARSRDYAGIYYDPTYNVYILPVVYVDGPNGGVSGAYAYGGEFSAQYALSDTWRVSGSYGHIENNYKEGESPNNQVRFVSSWDLGRHWTFDATWRYNDWLERWNYPSYITMDCRLAWAPTRRLECAVIGRNLFQDHRLEFGGTTYPYYLTAVERAVFGSVTWRY